MSYSRKQAKRCAAGTIRACLGALALCFLATGAEAVARDAATMALCRGAAIAAADRHGIPREVMLAITQVETRTKRGGRSGPWPWTVNVAGKGAWFDSRAAALVHAQRALAAGQKSFDVGCFQLNYRWHGEHFASIDAMFEPASSGDYAARFLKELYAEAGNWITASGHYHSRTPVHASRYRNLVAKAIRRMGGDATEAVDLAAAAQAGRRTAAVVTPLVVRTAAAGERTLPGVQVRTPRGAGRIDGPGMILRAPAGELLALR